MKKKMKKKIQWLSALGIAIHHLFIDKADTMNAKTDKAWMGKIEKGKYDTKR